MTDCGTSTLKFKSRELGLLLIALLAIALPASSAFGQTAPPLLTDSDMDALSANQDEVALDLVVRDKKDKPVLDLTRGDIAISDDDSPVRVRSLRLISGKLESAHPITLVFDRPSPDAAARHDANQLNYKSLMNSARDAAMQILKMVPEKSFSISVLDIDGRLRLEQGFTFDRKAIAKAIESATGPERSAAGDPADQPKPQFIKVPLDGLPSSGAQIVTMDRALTAAIDTAGRIAQDQHIRPSLAGLLALAQAERQIQHRKAVIYFTFSKQWRVDSDAKDTIESLVGAANRSGVSFYIVDLNALDRATDRKTLAETQTATPGTANDAAQFEFGSALTNSKPNSSAMQYLADATEGSYIATEDSLHKPLEQMIQDMEAYYEATYLPPNTEYDGKFHSIAVKSLREGLQIRSRTGYLALPPDTAPGASAQTFELPLLKILGESPLPTDLSFRASVLRMGKMPYGNVSALAVEVPLSSLDIREDSGTNLCSAHFSFIANIKDKQGATVGRFSEDVPRRQTKKEGDSANFDVIALQRRFIAPPGQYTLEAVVLDRNSGKAGAQIVPFDVSDSSSLPSLSDMILVRETEPLHSEDDPARPILHGADKITPNLSGQLPPGAKDVSIFFAAFSDPQIPAATLNVQVLRDGKLLGGAPMVARQTNDSGFTSYLTSFAVKPPMNGLYEVKAILNQGGKTAESKASFTLAGLHPAKDEAPSGDAALSMPKLPDGPLVITFPTNPIQRPSPERLNALLADATGNAIEYSNSLPNFMCLQVTSRSVDPHGTGTWKRKDKFSELLTYLAHEENRTFLQLQQNGLKTDTDKRDDDGALSFGEFGGVLEGVFKPSSKTDFQWKETGVLAGGTVQVFDYKVERKNSTFYLRDETGGRLLTVGFHGKVFIDSTTSAVRRITIATDEIPRDFRIHAVSVDVDYDYVAINSHDYLMPIGAQVILNQGGREIDMNEIEFRNFRRFGSHTRILNYSPETIH